MQSPNSKSRGTETRDATTSRCLFLLVKLAVNSRACLTQPGPLLLRVSYASLWEWLRVEQQPLNYADSSHNRGWGKVRDEAAASLTRSFRKPPSKLFSTPSSSLCLRIHAYTRRNSAWISVTRLKYDEWRVGRDSALKARGN